MKKTISSQIYTSLVAELSSRIEPGRRATRRHVNAALVVTYRLMGRRIVEFEQKARGRAE